MENAVTQIESRQVQAKQLPDLSMEIIKKYICPKATDQEAFMFLQLCRAQNLNPFLKEAYLVKYGDEAASIITGKDTFTKRADHLPQYDGFKAGIIVLNNNQAIYREGSFSVAGEKLLGGWAEVFRKDRNHSFRNEVSLSEYERKKKDGSLMSNWRTMPATMIRKVALVQSLREAFPDEFGGMYSPEEMPVDASALPVYEVGRPPINVTPEEANSKPPIKEPQKKADATTDPAKISDAQKKRFYAIAKTTGYSDDEIKAKLATLGIEHTADILKSQYDELCAWAEAKDRDPGEEG